MIISSSADMYQHNNDDEEEQQHIVCLVQICGLKWDRLPPPLSGHDLKCFIIFRLRVDYCRALFFFREKRETLLLVARERKNYSVCLFLLVFFSPSNYARARLFARMRSYSNTQERERKKKRDKVRLHQKLSVCCMCRFPSFFFPALSTNKKIEFGTAISFPYSVTSTV